MSAHHDISQCCHPFEEGNVLKGSGNTKGGNMVRPHGRSLFPFKEDTAWLWMIDATDHVDHGVLPAPLVQ
jgi:hypothetical protein